jgi:hypothetical protein
MKQQLCIEPLRICAAQHLAQKKLLLTGHAPQRITKALRTDIDREFTNIEVLPARITISPKAVGAASLAAARSQSDGRATCEA